MPSESRAFDRAADFYDKTRSLPADTMAVLVPRLAAAVRPGRCLEIGIGTGRIAIPLAQHGIPMTGIDLSRPMLEVLRSKDAALPVMEGDATRLPFPDSVFGTAVASHVFHLIPDWKGALDELARVLVPGGRIVASSRQREPESPLTLVRQRLRQETGKAEEHIGADQDGQALDDELLARGATATEIEPVTVSVSMPLSQLIDDLAGGIWSFTWDIDPAVLQAAAERTRAWAAAEYGDLDAPRTETRPVPWTAYDLPS